MRKTQRLDKILSNMGYGSRKEVKQLIKKGVVSVDSICVLDSSITIDPYKCRIMVNEKLLVYKQYIYIMMNKPIGVISATCDNELKTVIDILPEEYRHYNPFPAGRLDIDTVGLLLLTNAGKLAHRLTSPTNLIPKKYYALVDGRVTEFDIEKFREGVLLDDGYRAMPSELKILRSGLVSEVELIIYEGKFHQVKRMFKSTGKSVRYLKRLEIGNLVLDDMLHEGECRELTEEELDKLIEV